MAAIITDHFRRNQARLLVNDIKASADSEFDSTANGSSNSNESNWPYRGNNRYAVGLGKSDSWPAQTSGTVTENATNFVVPAPAGNRQEDEDIINNLFTLKDVGSGSSVKQLIAKNPWTTGRKYKVYDSADNDAFYATNDLYPCYVTHGNSVYIVLSNTAVDGGFSGVAASTQAPSVSNPYEFSQPAQGYVWCEVAKIDSSDALLTNQFVPIKRNVDVSPTIDPSMRKKTAGLLSHVGVISGGSGYSSNTTITATIVDHTGEVTTPAISFVPVIDGSGVIQRVDIRDPQNSPTISGSYKFWTAGDASAMVASSLAVGDRIKSINFYITDSGSGGSGESSSEAGGSGAQLSATIAPSTGYGYNAIDILPTWFVGISVDFDGLETDGDAPALKFRQVSLLKNFVRSADSGDTSAGTLDALKSITLHTPGSGVSSLTEGQILYQKTTNAKFYVNYYDSTTKKLYYHQNSEGDVNTIKPQQGTTGTNHAIGTTSGGTQVSNGVAAVNEPEYQSRIASGDELGEFNGEVVFHENRKPFSRDAAQKEEVKLIIQL
jgi:hypothetical protein